MKATKGRLVLRGNKYYAVWQHDGKRFCVATGCADESGATAKLAELIAPFLAKNTVATMDAIAGKLSGAQARAEKLEDAASPGVLLGQLWQTYQGSPRRPDSGERTLLGYKSQVDGFVKWLADSYATVKTMKEVTPQIASAYLASLRKKNVTASTFNQHLQTLLRVWRVLDDEARTKGVNPWAGFAARTVDKARHRKEALTLEQATKLVDAADGDLKSLLILLVCTGQRLGDVATMLWTAVDLKNGIIQLVPGKTARRKGQTVVIPILPQARAVLDALSHGSRYVLPSMAELYQFDRGAALSKRIRDVYEKAGFVTRVANDHGGRQVVKYGAHSARHAFVTIARAAGLPDALIQRVTGHTSSIMVNHYTHFDQALVSKLSKSFEALPAGAEPLALIPPATPTLTGTEVLDVKGTPLGDDHKVLVEVARLVEAMTTKDWQEMRTKILALLKPAGAA